MQPFRCSLLIPTTWLLAASAATASPLFEVPDVAFADATAIAFERLPESTDSSGAYFPPSVTIPAAELPLPQASELDSRALFRALLRGRDLRSERSVQGDLVAALPRLREERSAEIRELRGDARDPSASNAELAGPRVGMR